jgi:hypothetical protein
VVLKACGNFGGGELILFLFLKFMKHSKNVFKYLECELCKIEWSLREREREDIFFAVMWLVDWGRTRVDLSFNTNCLSISSLCLCN